MSSEVCVAMEGDVGAAGDRGFVVAFAWRHYGLRLVAAEQLRANADEGRALYRLRDGNGQSWALRLQRADRPVPAWFGGGGADDWLRERAALLDWLAGRAYPAPRLRRTREGAPVAVEEGWAGLLADFVAGTRPVPGEAIFAALAAALGRLHALDPGGEPPLAAHSWWHPADRAAGDGRRLLGPATTVPRVWRSLHAASREALELFARPLSLPLACLHGDSWLGNAVQTPDGHVALIDWEVAGLGAAVLEFGALLGDCFIHPAREPAPAPAWVAAVVDGYRQYRALTAAERGLLPAAIRFGAAFRTAIRFALAPAAAWQGAAARGLAHEQARLALSGEIATLALARIGDGDP